MASNWLSDSDNYSESDNDMDDVSPYYEPAIGESNFGEASLDISVNWENRPSLPRYDKPKPTDNKPDTAIRMGRELLGPDARHNEKRRIRGPNEQSIIPHVVEDETTRRPKLQSGTRRTSQTPSNGFIKPLQSPEQSRPGTIVIPSGTDTFTVSSIKRPEPRFQNAVFDAVLAKCEFSSQGEFIIRFQVGNPADVDEAIKLRDAYGLSLTLAITRKTHQSNG